jgi:hypothetical protein
MNDFSKLKPTEHMLKWLDEDPYVSIYEEVEQGLQKQVPESRLTAFRVMSDPQWLTGGKPDKDSSEMLLVRTGVAFEFELEVREPNNLTHELQGVFSWVGVHLDDPENMESRVWIDLSATLDTHGSRGKLPGRMYFA